MTTLFRTIRRWQGAGDGTTAVEFSLLAIPFVLTAIGIIELSLYFASGVLLEGAVQDTARLIRTGQLQQTAGDPLEEFMEKLCEKAGFLMDCDDFQYQVEKLDDFNDDIEPDIDDEGKITETFELDQITAGCVGLVRITYPYQFMTPVFAELWGNYAGGKRLLMSTIVFQTEPYNFVVSDPTCNV